MVILKWSIGFFTYFQLLRNKSQDSSVTAVLAEVRDVTLTVQCKLVIAFSSQPISYQIETDEVAESLHIIQPEVDQ